jgi:hypothetical protein
MSRKPKTEPGTTGKAGPAKPPDNPALAKLARALVLVTIRSRPMRPG